MTDAPTTNDPIELAMEAEAGATPTSEARELIRNQNRLVRRQIAAENAGIALRWLLGAAGVAAAAALAAMAWTASQADGVVLRPFSVAPQISAQGVTGEVLTAEFLDHINVQQHAAMGTALQTSSSVTGAIGDDLHLEIPQTGVSIGELNRALRAWIGHERVITGAMTQTGDNLTLTVRLAGESAVSVSGPASDRGAVVRAAAEQVFARADPLRAVFYLRQSGREEEMQALLLKLRSVGSPEERADGFSFTAVNTDDPELAMAYARQGVAIDPGFPMSYGELYGREWQLGRWEAARLHNRMHGERLHRRGELIFGEGALQRIGGNIRVREALLAGDYATAVRVNQQVTANALAQLRHNPQRAGDPEPVLAVYAAQAHDLGMAENQLRQAALRSVQSRELAVARARVDAAAERWATADAAYAVLLATESEDRRAKSNHPRLAWEAARVKAMLGDVAGAQALITPTALDCYPCLIVRGQIAARAGQPAEADRWFGAAVKAGPSLPQAEAAWAEVLLARRDFGNALSWAQAAHRKGPRFADPLAFAGEAQLALGDRKAAATYLRQAIQLAPAWDRPRRKLAEATR